jgi:iron complex outermembrane receptor protein
VEYFWGWQVTVPNAVRADQWRETFEVYVEDKYGQGLKEFFDRRNPWAYQSLAARMLEAVRKAYWKADEKTTRKLAAEYAVNVVQKGVACCDHTCNNPLLNQMVVSIISLPGVLSPEIVEQFKLAVEQAAGRKLKDQVQAHRQLQQTLQAGFNREREASRRTEAEPEARREEPGEKSPGADERVVEGYRMKEMKTAADRTEVSTSGVQWFASLFILFVIALFMVGARTGGVKAVSWFGVLLAGLLANALPAAAQHHAGHGAEKPVVMDAVTVTAERMEEYIKNHPQQVISMGREEILKRNLLSVEEALNTMPGVDVRRSAGIGSRISIRGSGKSGGVLVLFNGRPLNTSQYGGVDLEAIPVDLVESITVFMPPVPVWLGPGAVDGAISITTREFLPAVRSPKPAPTRLRLLAGSYGLAEGSLSQTWLTGRDNLLLSATGTHRDGKRPNSDRNSGSVALQWNRQDEAADQSELLGRYYGAEYGAPGPLDNPTPEARQRYRQGAFDAGRKGLLGESGEYALNAYGDLTALRDQSQTGFVSDLVDLKLGLKGQTVWSQAEGLWALRVNGLLEREEADYTLYGDHLRMLAGLSVNGDRNFGPATVTLGVRGDQTNDFGFNPGINGGVGVPLPAQCLLKANAGYLVKLPTFGQLYQTSHGSIDQVRGNPNLDKERIRSFELGLEHRPKKDRLVQLNLFRTETDEPIVYLRGPDLIYRPINADWSVRQGVDFSLKYAWEQGLALDAGIILQTSELQPGGKELPYTPGRKLKAALKYALPSWLTRLEAILRYEGEQFSEAENRPDQKLGDYFVVDVKAIQPFSAGGLEVEGFLHIENLFNRAYEIHYGYPDDGIRFIAGFNLKF